MNQEITDEAEENTKLSIQSQCHYLSKYDMLNFSNKDFKVIQLRDEDEYPFNDFCERVYKNIMYEEKDCPSLEKVYHYYIDFRHISLYRKIRYLKE